MNERIKDNVNGYTLIRKGYIIYIIQINVAKVERTKNKKIDLFLINIFIYPFSNQVNKLYFILLFFFQLPMYNFYKVRSYKIKSKVREAAF